MFADVVSGSAQLLRFVLYQSDVEWLCCVNGGFVLQASVCLLSQR